jgi:hypothetical protein
MGSGAARAGSRVVPVVLGLVACNAGAAGGSAATAAGKWRIGSFRFLRLVNDNAPFRYLPRV